MDKMADARTIENVSHVTFVVHRCDQWKCIKFLCIVAKNLAPYEGKWGLNGTPCVSNDNKI
jgi:hypothetical protein